MKSRYFHPWLHRRTVSGKITSWCCEIGYSWLPCLSSKWRGRSAFHFFARIKKYGSGGIYDASPPPKLTGVINAATTTIPPWSASFVHSHNTPLLSFQTHLCKKRKPTREGGVISHALPCPIGLIRPI